MRVRGGSIFFHSAGLAALVTLAAPALYAVPLRPDPTGGDGGSSSSGASNAAASPGPIQSWVGSVGDVATATGNKYTEIPIVSWVARGGLPVGFSLIHASESGLNITALSPKWSTSYSSSLAIWTNNSGQPCVTVYWGDQSAYTFINAGSGFAPPAGIHDKLTVNGGGYDLVTKDQVKYHFIPNAAYPGGTYFFLSSISDENGNTISINRSAGTGMLTSIVDPTNRTITLGYANGKLSSVTDPKNRVWTVNYDVNGKIGRIDYPALTGAVKSRYIGYNGSNDIITLTDLNGTTWGYGYNADDTVSYERDGCQNVTGFTYYSDHTVVTDPNSHTVTHWYYSTGQLSATNDASGQAEYYGYDGGNNRTQTVDRRGNAWNYRFDGNGNMLSEQDPPTAENPNGNTTRWTYNGGNKILTRVLPSGRSVANTYDAADNLTQMDEKDAAGTVLATTRYTVSAGTHGLVTDKYDAKGHHYNYGYDANGTLSDLYTPLGRHTHTVSNILGVTTSRTDALNRTTDYALDEWDRVTTKDFHDSHPYTYSYDPNSNLTGFGNYNGSFTRTYDQDNRITEEDKNGVRVISHTYDGSGQKGLLSTTTDSDGIVTTFAYTQRDELYSVSQVTGGGGTTTYGYDPNGNKTSVGEPVGAQVTRTFDAANRLSGVVNKSAGGATLSSYGYTYNVDSQRIGSSEGDGSAVSWGYDGQGHLAGDVRTGSAPYTSHYAADAVGNRTTSNTAYGNTTFQYDADDECLGDGGYFSFTYQATGEQVGSTLGGTTSSFTWDYDGNLTQIVTPSGQTILTYDALGRQIARSVNGVLTLYELDGDKVEAERQNGTIVHRNTWGDGLIRHDNDFPLSDGLENTRLILAPSGQTTATSIFDATGMTYGSTGSTGTQYLWGKGSGYRSDGDGPAGIGYSYVKVGARYYDPFIGRFISRDTDLSQSPYAYCDGDPVNYTDPDGHTAKKKGMPSWLQKLLNPLLSRLPKLPTIHFNLNGPSSTTTTTTVTKDPTSNTGRYSDGTHTQQQNYHTGGGSTTTTTHTSSAGGLSGSISFDGK